MNSNYGKNFDFDLGLGSSRPKSLNDKKNNNNPSYSSSSSNYSSYSSAQPKPAWQPNKPSWTHQPSPAQVTRPGLPNGPTSMVGDILGKSWTSSTPSTGSSSVAGIGIVDKNPNLFGDLVGSALGQGKSSNSTNVPLKNSTPVSNKNTFSMGNVADSLPKTNPGAVKTGLNWGASGNISSNTNANNNNRTQNLGGGGFGVGIGGGGGGGGMNSKDPFGSLLNFAPKPSVDLNSKKTNNAKVNNNNNTNDDIFGNFQNATTKPESNPNTNKNTFQTGLNMDDFVKLPTQNSTQSPVSDPLDMLFPTTKVNLTESFNQSTSNGSGQQTSEMDSWGFEPHFEGDDGGTTTELDGLPPPPSGVNSSMAKNKGMDNYKQGQYADAIKWLSWAVILLEKAGDNNATFAEVLSSRASCYKEVGEYKKAVADCTKVLEQDGANVSVLVQRALLYESMEKYRLGAEDLRAVLKIDPSNRVARSTVHRLTKLAD
ncbi:hypothetical protein CsatB_025820 [Cannabis sativa]|uniref:Uncharacterized protein n=1 Tax=Cannabis sativa TaxID=3483 RepID=A0A7J6EAY1_CANSA|nr:hypothetical protein F8388_013022 [Cannabis sativa]KAF4359922.1 hypothetical protein G4B88_028673 [Cannabis sativa]KAF4393628.1 hypothetical protein G4B88_007614 [Cannabis sativa]